MPVAIHDLFVLFYVMLTDRWNEKMLSKGLEIDEERNSVTKPEWLNAFGMDFI